MDRKTSRKVAAAASVLKQVQMSTSTTRSMLLLGVECLDTDDQRGQFIEALLGQSQQLLRHRPCGLCERSYVLSEFNRDGDYYRSPWANKYFLSSPANDDLERDADVTSSFYRPSKPLREMEKLANAVFDAYSNQYYAFQSHSDKETRRQSVVSSVYVWQHNDADDSGNSPIGVAVMILKEFKARLAEGRDVSSGVWNSTHLATIEVVSEDTYRYTVGSSVLLQFLDASNDAAHKQHTVVSGHLERTSAVVVKTFVAKSQLISRSKLLGAFHIETIGNLVQEAENMILGSLSAIYFTKPLDLLSKIRKSRGARGTAMLNSSALASTPSHAPAHPNGHGDGVVEPALQPAEDVGQEPAQAEKKAKKKKKKPVWEEVYDDEGNLYYYNTLTEETQWERPEELGAPDEPPVSYDAEPQADPNAAIPLAVLLDQLGLASEGYELLFMGQVTNAAELVTFLSQYTGDEDGTLTALGIDDSSHRKKLVKWFRKQTAA